MGEEPMTDLMQGVFLLICVALFITWAVVR